MSTQVVSWQAERPSLHDLGHYLLRMSRDRSERFEREHHHEHEHRRGHESTGERSEHRERGERRDLRERGGRGRRHVGRGDVYAATLLLLEEQSLHGYQIIQLIEERSDGYWRPSA